MRLGYLRKSMCRNVGGLSGGRNADSRLRKFAPYDSRLAQANAITSIIQEIAQLVPSRMLLAVTGKAKAIQFPFIWKI